jgi:hypothetical protein
MRVGTMASISKTELLRRLSKARYPQHDKPRTVTDALTAADRRALQKLHQTFVARSGVDVKTFETIHKHNQAELRRRMQADHAAAIKRAAAYKKELLKGVANHLEAVNGLISAGRPDVVPLLISLNKPFLIWASPQASIMSDSHIAPGDSWVKTRIRSTASYTEDKLSFYFEWRNPADYEVVITAGAHVSVVGHCFVGRDGGMLPDNRDASILADTLFFPWRWWMQPASGPMWQAGQEQVVFNVSVSGGGFFDLGEVFAQDVSAAGDTHHDMLIVPPNAVVVFEVALRIMTSNHHGVSDADFESGAFRIHCPGVLISVLTSAPTA